MPPNLIHSSAVASANYYLGKNQKNFQQSMKRIASGKKINGPGDDPRNLAVSMKLNAQLNRISGVQNNIQNSISFLGVQDGTLETAGKLISRMIELRSTVSPSSGIRGLTRDSSTESPAELESYNTEFMDLQVQLYGISQSKFNGVSLFANTLNDDLKTYGPGSSFWDHQLTFGEDRPWLNSSSPTTGFHTVGIPTNVFESAATSISIHKSALLAAVTIQLEDPEREDNNLTYFSRGLDLDWYRSFAASGSANAWRFDDGDRWGIPVSLAIFEQAFENLTVLRTNNASQQSQLNFAADNLDSYETGLRSAIGRIEDVDIAQESANLAKYSILTQASAAMVAQATSQSQSTMRLLLEM